MTGNPARRRRVVDLLILLNGISTFGSGVIYPYTAIHLAAVPAFGTAGVSVFWGVSAAANLATTTALAFGPFRPRPELLGATGAALLGVGWAAAGFAASMPVLAAAVLILGCGQGMLLVALVPVLNAQITPDQRRVTFARRYRAVNLGLGLGAVTAGLLTGIFSGSVIRWLFLVNAASYLPIALALLWVGRQATAVHSGQRGPVGGGRRRPDRVVALAVAFQLGAYLLAHSQFEATAPLVAVRLMGVTLGAVSVLLLLNTAVVVAAQRWVNRLLEARPETAGLRVAVLLWAAAYVLIGAAAAGPAGVRLASLPVFAVVFALGECAYSYSYHPWLISTVTDAEVTRASALASAGMGIGTAAGPSIGVALVATGSAAAVWLVLAGSCLLMLPLLAAAGPRPPTRPAPDLVATNPGESR